MFVNRLLRQRSSHKYGLCIILSPLGWHALLRVHVIVFCAPWLEFTLSVLPCDRSLVAPCFALCVFWFIAFVVVSPAGVGIGNVDALSLFFRFVYTLQSCVHMSGSLCASLFVHAASMVLMFTFSCSELTSHVALFALCLYWRQMLLTFTWDA